MAYDFNLAFDVDFNCERFFEAHVFGGMLKRWPDGFRERMEPMIAEAPDPKGCQLAFNEVVRARESVLRFGEVRTITSTNAKNVPDELCRRYVLMEPAEPQVAAAS